MSANGHDRGCCCDDCTLAALVADGWRPGRFGPLCGSVRFPTRSKEQLARAVPKLRLAQAMRRVGPRTAYLDWEEAQFQLGRRFSVQEWRGRFRRSHKCWERWVRKGRESLGLSLRFVPEDTGSGGHVHYLTITDEDAERLAWLRTIVDAWYLHGVQMAGHEGRSTEGLRVTAPRRRSA